MHDTTNDTTHDTRHAAYFELLCSVLVEGREGEVLGVLLGELAELKVVFSVQGGGH
jgi:hypothetical protein